MHAIIHVILFINQANSLHPVPRLDRPVGVRCIIGVSCQPRPEVEEDAIRDSILVVISHIRWRHLPPQPAATDVVVAIGRGLGIEHALRKRQPLCTLRIRFEQLCRWIWEVIFSRQHGGHAPEALVVVPEGQGPVVVLERIHALEDYGVLGHVVPSRVTG